MSAILEKKVTKKAALQSPASSAATNKVFLLGMMGSGKSFWADKLKKKLKVSAYDLDALIEMMEEKSIAEIFAEDGEEYFRKTEAKMLRLFAEKKNFILSCGGGTACYNDNMKWMNKQGITIWIDEPVETLSARLAKEKAHRPLIKNLSDEEITGFLEKKMEEREAFYSEASYRLQGDELTESAFMKILKEYA